METRQVSPSNPSGLELQLNEFRRKLEEFSQPAKSFLPRLWAAAPDSNQLLAQELKRKLNLNPFMNKTDLAKALLVIESIQLAGQKETLGKHLEGVHAQVFADVQITNSEVIELKKMVVREQLTPDNALEPKGHLPDFLADLHATLWNWYRMSIDKFNDRTGAFANDTINYTPEMLKQSDAVRKFQEYTLQDYPTDSANLVEDREMITINRRFMTEQQISNESETAHEDRNIEGQSKQKHANLAFYKRNYPETMRAITEFTGENEEDIFSPTSKAHKLFYFGHQHLYPLLLTEFTNSTIFPSMPNTSCALLSTPGHIDWSRDENDGTIKARVQLRGYLTQQQITNGEGDDKFIQGVGDFTLGSDASSLVEFKGSEEVELIRLRSKKENKREPDINMIPICRMEAEITLKQNHVGRYYMEVTKLLKQYNTPDLVDTYQLQKQEELEKVKEYKPDGRGPRFI